MQEIARRLQASELALERGRLELELYAPELCTGERVAVAAGRAKFSRPTRDPKILLNLGELPGPATISPCTITMDLGVIIFSMIDRLARGPDQDVHVPSVVGPKYPSRRVYVIYL